MNDKTKKKPQDKKPGADLLSILMVVLMLAAGAGIGVFSMMALEPMLEEMSVLQMIGAFAYLVIWVYGALLLQAVIHEAGHMVGGLLTGYRFVSFNIMGAIWQKGPDGKIRMGRMKMAGMGGQCLMAPPAYDEGRFPCTVYNLGGVAANVIVSGLLLAAWLAFRPGLLLTVPLVTMALIGFVLAVVNGIPLPGGGVQNDGANQVCISRSVHAKRALWVQISLAEAVSEGKRLRELPEEWFAPFPEEEMDNPIVCAISVFDANRLIDALRFEEAEQAILRLLAREKGVLPLHRMLLTADGAVCELIAGRPGELTESLDSKQNQQLIKAMKQHPSILRTQYALALLRDRDGEKAGKLLEQFERAAQKHPNPQEIIGERELLLAIQNAELKAG